MKKRKVNKFQQGGIGDYLTWMSDYVKSETYLNKLLNLYPPEENPRSHPRATDLQNTRLRNIQNLSVNNRSDEFMDEKFGEAVNANYDPDFHSLNFRPFISGTTAIHEIAHGSTKGNSLLGGAEADLIKGSLSDDAKKSEDKYIKYLSSPTEYHARLTALKWLADKKGITPIDKDLNLETLWKLYEDDDAREILQQLFEVTKETDTGDPGSQNNRVLSRGPSLIELWNKLAVNDTGSSLPIGKKGGVIPSYQMGGSPVYVTNPNDPRLKSYQDSLFLHNFLKGWNSIAQSEDTPQGRSKRLDDYLEPRTNRLQPLLDNPNFQPISEDPLIEMDEDNRFTTVMASFPKPKQPVQVVKKRDKESVGKLLSLTLKELENITPIPVDIAPNPLHEDGEFVAPWEGVPNLSVVFRKNKGKSDFTPYAIENTEGKRILYKEYRDKKLPADFQHPPQMNDGGTIDMKKKKRKKKSYQQGGITDLLSNLSPLAELFNDKDFNFQDALNFGFNNGLGLETGLAVGMDSEEPIVNAGLNKFAQLGAQGQKNQFLENPTSEGLEDFGQGLRPGQKRRIGRRLDKGRNLTNRQERLLEDSAQESLPNVQAGFGTDIQDQFGGLQGLASLFENFFQFKGGGVAKKLSPIAHSMQQRKFQQGGVASPFTTASNILKGSKDAVSEALNVLGVSSLKDFQKEAGIKRSGRKNKETLDILSDLFIQQSINSKPNINRSPLEGVDLREMQDGGVAELGFSRNSPFKTRKEINIPGQSITMENTDLPLALIPNRGKPVIAPPRSGRYTFPGASNVREVRLFQLGGEVGYLPVQLEVGEMIVLPDASIVDTKAKEKHKNMKKDHVTDILMEGAFVGSADKKTLLKKKKAEKISFGYEPVIYDEYSIGDEPKEILFSDFFKDDESMLPADLLRRIRRTYPISDREDDPFTDRAKEENRESRLPLIAATVFMTKHDPSQMKLGGRVKKENISDLLGRPEETDSVNIPNTPPSEFISKEQKGGVPKYQLGDLIGPAFQAGVEIWSLPWKLLAARKQRLAAKQQMDQNISLINQGAQNQQQFAGLGTGLGFLSTMAQNPYVNAPQFDESAIRALPQELPQSLIDASAARIGASQQPLINNIFSNTGNFSRAVNSATPLSAQRVGALADLGLSSAMQSINMRRDYLTRLNDVRQRQVLADTDAQNRTRGNSNFLLSQLGNLGIGFGNQMGQIDANRITNTLGARGANFAAQQQAYQNSIGAVNNTLGTISGLGYGLSPFLNQQFPGSGNGLPNQGGQLVDQTCPCDMYNSAGQCLC